ncbi:MAG TPA: ABC transporter permease [Streptosporangiaceae bacterium]
MTRLIVRRLVSAVVIIIVLTGVLFVLQQTSHTNPIRLLVGANAPQSVVQAARHRLGYDQPVVVQYGRYLRHLARGNFGISLRTHDTVGADIATFLPATVELALFGMLVAAVLAVIIGIGTAGGWHGSGAVKFVTVALASAPPFFLAIGGILIFAHRLTWLPATGQTSYLNPPAGPTGLLVVDALLHGEPGLALDALRHLVLPGLCIAVGPAVSVGRVLRSSMQTALASDYVRTARAKGRPEFSILFRHALRNALTAPLAMTGLQVGLLFAGDIIVETVFAWPGIGLYVDQSIPSGDFPAIAGVTLLLGVGYVVINTAVDLLQVAADPRIAAS